MEGRKAVSGRRKAGWRGGEDNEQAGCRTWETEVGDKQAESRRRSRMAARRRNQPRSFRLNLGGKEEQWWLGWSSSESI